ncbi:DsrE family protein [Saccharophagus degradans]|uniref:DsrE family protein n=1 Tax=Saccharophagus degradans TaxID=86304 RepID=UPI0024781608|nr:DsrE family protein [Saccharophagus degradans]WGO99557.1 DsrE family protein [Saccharophagus degradans]
MKWAVSLLLFISIGAWADSFKVVYHVNEPEKVKLLISSVEELLNVTPDSIVEVVVHGPGIIRLSKSDSGSSDVKALINRGVKVGACSISMLKRGLNPRLMVNGVVQLEQGGVYRVLELQKLGYYYIKI